MFQKETVQHFGLWAEEEAPFRERAYVLTVLRDAVSRCRDEDVRTPYIKSAIEFMSKEIDKPILARRLWEAFQVHNPEERERAARVAFDVLKRTSGG